MARPSATACTRTTFTADVGCLKKFDSNERQALMIYFNVLELAALGGTDYTGELGPSGDLALDSACDNTLDPLQKDLALLLINMNNASDAGATVPDTQDALAQAISCLKNFPPAMLDAMALNVQCLLGRHAEIPQSDL